MGNLGVARANCEPGKTGHNQVYILLYLMIKGGLFYPQINKANLCWVTHCISEIIVGINDMEKKNLTLAIPMLIK